MEKQELRFKAAVEKIKRIAPVLRNRETAPMEKGPLWQRIVFTGLYRMSFSKVPERVDSVRQEDPEVRKVPPPGCQAEGYDDEPIMIIHRFSVIPQASTVRARTGTVPGRAV